MIVMTAGCVLIMNIQQVNEPIFMVYDVSIQLSALGSLHLHNVLFDPNIKQRPLQESHCCCCWFERSCDTVTESLLQSTPSIRVMAAHDILWDLSPRCCRMLLLLRNGSHLLETCLTNSSAYSGEPLPQLRQLELLTSSWSPPVLTCPSSRRLEL